MISKCSYCEFLSRSFLLIRWWRFNWYTTLKEFRTSAGSLGGIAGANLVALAMVISLVYAMLAMASVLNFGLLPDFILDHLVSFLNENNAKILM